MIYSDFTDRQKAELLQDIVKDAVMFKQLFIIMDAVQRTFAPHEDTMYYAADYSGIYSAFNLIGYPFPQTLEEEERTIPIREEMERIFDKTIKKNSKRKLRFRKDATALAKKIIFKWNVYLNTINQNKTL
ncbi:hypothetical protein LZ575_03055 [Antarcticibacterium sp. 1MA-6-2]|uniref:hypothetical protein n=1 Tax=Antarcticibacterium sp. 1MA-6-2 TaxID=2908210 RepID=UPI001F31A043|nr:hypothetical protein [Antarcticibacterium sp. 1MA-6-2]UJH91681.1 hypothetical protein LZ575_03055 [Antarcticibacterium sp. 1MA-6-2]